MGLAANNSDSLIDVSRVAVCLEEPYWNHFQSGYSCLRAGFALIVLINAAQTHLALALLG